MRIKIRKCSIWCSANHQFITDFEESYGKYENGFYHFRDTHGITRQFSMEYITAFYDNFDIIEHKEDEKFGLLDDIHSMISDYFEREK